MQLTGHTILITGGSSGIGVELARQLCADNTVIITGRDQEKLNAAKAALHSLQMLFPEYLRQTRDRPFCELRPALVERYLEEWNLRMPV